MRRGPCELGVAPAAAGGPGESGSRAVGRPTKDGGTSGGPATTALGRGRGSSSHRPSPAAPTRSARRATPPPPRRRRHSRARRNTTKSLHSRQSSGSAAPSQPRARGDYLLCAPGPILGKFLTRALSQRSSSVLEVRSPALDTSTGLPVSPVRQEGPPR